MRDKALSSDQPNAIYSQLEGQYSPRLLNTADFHTRRNLDRLALIGHKSYLPFCLNKKVNIQQKFTDISSLKNYS